MKIMFVGSIRQKSVSEDAYKRIIRSLKADGHQVIHEHVTTNSQNDLDKMSQKTDSEFHQAILKNIKNADLVVSEVSSQSLSVGYLLAYAASAGKPVVTLFQEKVGRPNLFKTLMDQSKKFFLASYSSLDDLEDVLMEQFDYAKEQVDVRFNFFISPAIANYLDWISKVKKIPRSVYLRALIEREMEENKEYH